MKNVILFAVLLSAFSNSFANHNYFPTDSIGTKEIDGKPFVIYLVNAGETIYSISTRFQVPITDLMEINPSLETGLKTGQIINIPYRKAQIEEHKASNLNLTHVVQPGETLYSLSKKYGIALNDLLRLNGMELQAGQTIVVGYKNEGGTGITRTVSVVNPGDSDIKHSEIKKVEKVAEVEKPKETVVVKKETDRTGGEGVKKVNKKEEAVTISSNTAVKKNEKKVVVASQKKSEIAPSTENLTSLGIPIPEPALGPKTNQRILIVPFDPYLYFSDADDEIAQTSRIHRTKVRQVFRKRLNALLMPRGYETIHLLGGVFKDSIGTLNQIYKSVNYNYQDILDNGRKDEEQFNREAETQSRGKKWVKAVRQIANPANSYKDGRDKRYFGVRVKNADFFTYFNAKYDLDYYIFINQFEVKTNYENCLDRASQNYERSFLVHYSIFKADGEQIVGNKARIYYHSNNNNVKSIVKENMYKIANQILGHLPSPEAKK